METRALKRQREVADPLALQCYRALAGVAWLRQAKDCVKLLRKRGSLSFDRLDRVVLAVALNDQELNLL